MPFFRGYTGGADARPNSVPESDFDCERHGHTDAFSDFHVCSTHRDGHGHGVRDADFASPYRNGDGGAVPYRDANS